MRQPTANEQMFRSALRPGQGEDALGEVVQEFPGSDSGTAGAEIRGGRGG